MPGIEYWGFTMFIFSVITFPTRGAGLPELERSLSIIIMASFFNGCCSAFITCQCAHCFWGGPPLQQCRSLICKLEVFLGLFILRLQTPHVRMRSTEFQGLCYSWHKYNHLEQSGGICNDWFDRFLLFEFVWIQCWKNITFCSISENITHLRIVVI